MNDNHDAGSNVGRESNRWDFLSRFIRFLGPTFVKTMLILVAGLLLVGFVISFMTGRNLVLWGKTVVGTEAPQDTRAMIDSLQAKVSRLESRNAVLVRRLNETRSLGEISYFIDLPNLAEDIRLQDVTLNVQVQRRAEGRAELVHDVRKNTAHRTVVVRVPVEQVKDSRIRFIIELIGTEDEVIGKWNTSYTEIDFQHLEATPGT